MRRSFVVFFSLLLIFAGCGGGRTTAPEAAADSDTVVTDTIVSEPDSLLEEVAEAPMPKAIDELFDDFIFNFASNRKLQMERVAFPLPSVNGQKTELIEREAWKMDYFFMRQGYYTILFGTRQQMEAVKDTSIGEAIVEKVYFNTNSIIQYHFNRRNGAWMLTAIHTIPIATSENASFLAFYHQSSTDKDFQADHLADEVRFVGPDPDDDFSQMEGIITADTWEAFAPDLPSRMIYNIIYGHPQTEGNRMYFVLRGIANGSELEMIFERHHDSWRLTKLSA